MISLVSNLHSAAAQSPSATAPAPAPGSTPEVSNLFLQLLSAQLKGQSPLDPVDPTQFLQQLIQLNTLDQITQIRSLIQTNGKP